MRKVERRLGRRALKLFIVRTVDRRISKELRRRCEEEGIELIVGREAELAVELLQNRYEQ